MPADDATIVAGPPASESLLVTIDEAARLLVCGRSLLKLMIRRGEIPTRKIGRLTRIPRAFLVDFVAGTDGEDVDVAASPPQVERRPANRRGPVRRGRSG